MNHQRGLDRSQTLLFPERLEDYITPENPGRFLDAFVGSLDLHGLGFAKARVASAGLIAGDDIADMIKSRIKIKTLPTCRGAVLFSSTKTDHPITLTKSVIFLPV